MKLLRLQVLSVLAVVFTVAAPAGAAPETPYVIDWIRQFGPGWPDGGHDVAADALGNVYIAGRTMGSLGGPNMGYEDAFVSKYDSAGALVWTGQLGTPNNDKSYGVSLDGFGNVYIAGIWNETGRTIVGDIFVSKYSPLGQLLWTRTLDTGGSNHDQSNGVSADDPGNVYISGQTNGSLVGSNAGDFDAFLSKFDSAGVPLWTRQFGTSSYDNSSGVSADGTGNVFVAGYTRGSLGGPNAGETDAFVCNFTPAGVLRWTRQFGTSSYDSINAVSADGLGNVYVSGETDGSLDGPNAGMTDAFVSKFNWTGARLWTRQFGTSSPEYGWGVSADGLDGVYVTGATYGSLAGPQAGKGDAFITKYDPNGNLLWSLQLGTDDRDWSLGAAADGLGNVYIAGETWGPLGDPEATGTDAFLAKARMAADFTGDGEFDYHDLARLAHYWLTYEPSIAFVPGPYGDAIVNLYEFSVFSDHWMK